MASGMAKVWPLPPAPAGKYPKLALASLPLQAMAPCATRASKALPAQVMEFNPLDTTLVRLAGQSSSQRV